MDFIELRSFDNYIEANIVLNMLRHYNINCYLKNEDILTTVPFLNNDVGGMKLMVHHAHVERAWDLIDEAEEAYLGKIPCPICHSHTLKAINVTKQHRSRLSALASMLLNGHSLEVTKIYRCQRCGYDFKELPKQ